MNMNKLKNKGKLLSNEHVFYMPLVYFNSAHNSVNDFSAALEEFNEVRDWFFEKKRELDAFYSENKSESFDFLQQWPDGLELDLNGAFEQAHSYIAKTMASFFNFLTNTVAAVESSVQLKIAKLLNTGEVSDEDISLFYSQKIGIAKRTKFFLTWMEERKMVPPVPNSAIDNFQAVVTLRNHFVHYEFSPAVFSTDEIEISKIIGDEKVSKSFCLQALTSLKIILIALYDSDPFLGEMVFEHSFSDYSPPMTPSPYIVNPR